MKTNTLIILLLALVSLPLTAQKMAVYASGSAQRVTYALERVDAGGISISPGDGYGGRLGLSLGIPVNFLGKEPGEIIVGLGIDQQRGLAISGTKESVVDSAGMANRIVNVTHVLRGRNALVLELGVRGAYVGNSRLRIQSSILLYRWGREFSTSAYRSLDLDGVPLGENFREPLQVLTRDQMANNANRLFSPDKRPDNPDFSLGLGVTFSYELGKGIEVFLANEISVTNGLDRDFYELPGRRLRFDSFQLGFRGRLF